MKKKTRIIRISAGALAVLVLAGLLFLEAQEPAKVTLRYKFNAGDRWKYECVTESETDEQIKDAKNKYLQNIKTYFNYEVQDLTPEGYWKVELSTIPVESKGVYIIAGKKEETSDFEANQKYEEFLTERGELFEMLSETSNGKKPYIYRQETAKELGFPIPDIINANPLFIRYDDMIRYFRPVMPEGSVGINDTWSYSDVVLFKIPQTTFNLLLKPPVSFLAFNYKVAGFENKDGFDCIKVEYNYDWDFSDKLNGLAKEKKMDEWLKFELKVKGSGIFYFAYNEGFLVSRKENLMLTDIETNLSGRKLGHPDWGVGGRVFDEGTKKTIKRIGFTMNYIKPQ